MPKTTREWFVLAVALGACAVLLLLVITKRTQPTTSAGQPRPEASTRITTPTASQTTAPARPARKPARQGRVRLLVAAKRGDSWLVVRSGSATGRVLFEGLLLRGRTVRLSDRRLWLRVGAGANLDATVNGKATPLGAGTFDAVLTRGGLRPAP